MSEPRLYYLLDPMTHEVTSTDDIQFWAAMFEGSGRIVARTELDEVAISTVFLGLDHRFGEGPPLLFETMVFGGAMDDTQARYSTWDDAVAGHQNYVEAAMSVHTPWRRFKAAIKNSRKWRKLKYWWWDVSRKIELLYREWVSKLK